ncbi:MAG: anaerobic ribonucleoside-triphosphate reductase [Chlamydiota bacterium]
METSQENLFDSVKQVLVATSRENANINHSPSAKMLQIGSLLSKEYYLSEVIPPKLAKLHIDGDIHIHDLDFYGKTLTCLQIPLAQLLREGFNPGNGYIRPPKRPLSTTMLAAIILQSAQNDMHGGQSFAFFDRDMAPYMEDAPENEVYQAMESLVYNLNSMRSRAGAQVPFSSINLGTDTSEGGRKTTRNLLLAYKNGLGKGENPIFPNIIFRIKEGVNLNKEDPNRDLFELAMQVAAKCMNPTFSFMDATFNKQYGDEVSYMGCRTRVIANNNGPAVSEKRGNLSFSSINLPRIAIKAQGDINKFYELLDEVMKNTASQLFQRYSLQAQLKVKDMPFVMGQKLYMDSDNLSDNDILKEVIKHGTLSLGFIGLAEALTALTGHHHGESQKSQKLGLEIVEHMSLLVQRFSSEYNLNYTMLATPAEGLAGRFIAIDRKKYGAIKGVTDKEYYSNSFHIPVSTNIKMADKVLLEGPYHKYCNAGHISYIELPSSPENNIEALETILRHMINSDMGYAGINFPIDFCMNCSHREVIHSDKCPICNSTDIKRIRRITGYFSTLDNFGDAKRHELHDRTAHKF